MLTTTGRTALVLAFLSAAFGTIFRYRSLLAVAAGLGLAVAASVLYVVRKHQIATQRRLLPDRVTSGHQAHCELTLENTTRHRISSGIAYERFGAKSIPVLVPDLPPFATTVIMQPLPTERRGVYQVGPLSLNRSDPFGFVERQSSGESSSTLYVHPVIHELEPFPSGLIRDLDGPSSGEAPEGGIAFQNIREYVVGDDRRLIHWRSSAKTGQLMVRHNVDTHQPRTLVILDTRESIHDEDSFEEAISVAASIVNSSLRRRFPCRLMTTCGIDLDGSSRRGVILDRLAGLVWSDQGDIGETARRARNRKGGFSLALISGRAPADDLIAIGPLRARFRNITIGRLGAPAGRTVVELPGATVINARTGLDFASAWNQKQFR